MTNIERKIAIKFLSYLVPQSISDTPFFSTGFRFVFGFSSAAQKIERMNSKKEKMKNKRKCHQYIIIPFCRKFFFSALPFSFHPPNAFEWFSNCLQGSVLFFFWTFLFYRFAHVISNQIHITHCTLHMYTTFELIAPEPDTKTKARNMFFDPVHCATVAKVNLKNGEITTATKWKTEIETETWIDIEILDSFR